MEVHLRALANFLVLAEDENMTRAADRLQISQPALSKQIRQLESTLGVELFERVAAGMTLTAAGRALRPEAERVLTAWQHAALSTRLAADDAARRLRIGFVAATTGPLTQAIARYFTRLQPHWRLAAVQSTWRHPTLGVLEGRADISLVHGPVIRDPRLAHRELVREPRVLAMSDSHPLTQRRNLSFADLFDQPFVALPIDYPERRSFWLCDELHGDHPRQITTEVETPDEWLLAVANSTAVAFAAASAAHVYAGRGIAFRSLPGIPPSPISVVWRKHDNRPALIDLLAAVIQAVTSNDTSTDPAPARPQIPRAQQQAPT